MSIQPHRGILNIPNATLRVGKLEIDSTAGFDTVLNSISTNTVLLEDVTEYTENNRWGLKMPNVFVATFEIQGVNSSFNFQNTSVGTATTGYTLDFNGTTLTLKYGGGTLTTATIPNLDATYGKVYLTYEKQYFTMTVDGTQVLAYKDTVTRTPPDGEFINFFEGTGTPKFENLKVVAGHLISDGTSNVSLMSGNLGIGTDTPLDTLHVDGGIRFAGHIIPMTNAAFDIGSAENKIRDMYVDTNSLWIGDVTKIAFDGGKMKFKKRKVDKVPRMLVTLAIAHGRTDEADVQAHALAFAQGRDDTITTVSDLKLQDWRDYTQTFDDTKAISDIFADNDEDYEAITASEAFAEVGTNIFTNHSLSIGKSTDPAFTLDVEGDAAISSNLVVDTNTLFVDSVANRVGIGTTNPSNGVLDVAGTLRVGTDTAGLINLGRSGNVANYRLGNIYHDGTNMQLLNQEDGLLRFGTNNGIKMSILANGDVAISSNLAVDTNTLFVDSVGNKVGIGKTNPGSALDVVGDVEISGSLTVPTISAVGFFNKKTYTFNPTGNTSKYFVGVSYSEGMEIEISDSGHNHGSNQRFYITRQWGGVPALSTADVSRYKIYNFYYTEKNERLYVWFNETSNSQGNNVVYTVRVKTITSTLGPEPNADAVYISHVIGVNNAAAFPAPTIYKQNGNVGIGTDSPTSNLHVVGDVAISSNLAVDTNTLFVDSVGNKVGIGTATPGAPLEVHGADLTGEPVGTTSLISRHVGGGDGVLNIFGVMATHGEETLGLQTQIDGRAWQADIDGGWSTGNDSRYDLALQPYKGNVGIGTTNPGSALDVVGDVAISSNLAVDTNTLFVDSVGNKVGIGTANPDTLLHLEDSVPTIRFVDTDTGVDNNQQLGGIEFYSRDGTGSGYPNYELASIKCVNSANSGAAPDGELTFSTGRHIGTGILEMMRINADGNVGIGTTSPETTLQLHKEVGDDTLKSAAEIKFSTNNSANTTWDVGSIRGAVTLNAGGSSNYPGGLVFATKSPGGAGDDLTDKMVIDANGNVGIGTDNPDVKLQVEGTSSSHHELVKLATWNLYHNNSNGSADGVTYYTVGGSQGTDFFNNRNNFIYVQIPEFSGETLYTHTIIASNATAFKMQLRDLNGVKPVPPQNTLLRVHGYSKRTDPYGNITTRGNVGIGTTSPGAKLDVNGNLRVTGGIVDTSWCSGSWLQTCTQSPTVSVYSNNGGGPMTVPSHGGSGMGGNRGRFTAKTEGNYLISCCAVHSSRGSTSASGSELLVVFHAVGTNWNLNNVINTYDEIIDLRTAPSLEEAYTFACQVYMNVGHYFSFRVHSSDYIDNGTHLLCSAALVR